MNMTHEEIKTFIAQQTCEGLSLSQIQDLLTAKGAKLSFMELRLIAAEIDTEFWQQLDAKKEKPKAAEPPETQKSVEENPDSAFPENDFGTEANDDYYAGMKNQQITQDKTEPDKEPALRGKTSVTVSKIQRPGFAATGSVMFGSGASGDWCLDQYGRLMFEKLNGKPDEQDIQEFQLQLQRAFGA